jgi:hypothetical protein
MQNLTEGEGIRKVSQDKVSIPREEWQLVNKYFEEHKRELLLKGIKSPTALLRRWILEKYEENISRE